MADADSFTALHKKFLSPADDLTIAKSFQAHGEANPVQRPGDTVIDRNIPVRDIVYQTTSRMQPLVTKKNRVGCKSYHKRTHSESSAVTTLLIECPGCGGAGLKTTGHPLDPYARVFDCDRCEGTGEVVAGCECCREDATEEFAGMALCAACAAEQRADAIDAQFAGIEAQLDQIEALTDWCRAHAKPPPADLLYRAAAAVDRLRRAG